MHRLLATKVLRLLRLLAHLHAAHEAVLAAVTGAGLPQRAVAVAYVDGLNVARDLDAGALAEVRDRAGLPGDDAAVVEAGGAGVAGIGLGLEEVGEIGATGEEGSRGRGGEGGQDREGEDGRQTHGGDVGLFVVKELV